MLHVAAEANDEEFVKKLLDAGANPHAKDRVMGGMAASLKTAK